MFSKFPSDNLSILLLLLTSMRVARCWYTSATAAARTAHGRVVVLCFLGSPGRAGEKQKVEPTYRYGRTLRT